MEIDGGQFDASLRVDYRWASEAGRAAITNEITQLPRNLKKAGKTSYRDTLNLVEAVQETATGQGQDGIWQDYQGKRRNLQVVSTQDDIALALDNLDKTKDSQATLTQLLTAIANDSMDQISDDHDVTIQLYRDFQLGEYGFYDRDSQTIYVNLAYQDGSSSQLLAVLGDELSHAVDHALGRPSGYSDRNRQRISTQYGDNAEKQSHWYGDSESDYSVFQARFGSVFDDSFGNENKQASGVSERETRLFLYKDNVVATDGVADGLVVDLSMGGYRKLIDVVHPLSLYNIDNGRVEALNNGYGASIYTVETTFNTGDRVYDLSNHHDFNSLRARTDLGYYETMGSTIYFFNGMNNDLDDAKYNAKLLSDVTQKQPINIMHNDTDGIVGDVKEYVINRLTTKDVIHAHTFTEIAQNGGGYFISFSAGNEDVFKALEVVDLQKQHLGNQIKFISVGSPVSQKKLKRISDKTGVEFVGQYNDWKDPVTNTKTWIAGTSVAALTMGYGGYWVASSAINLASAGWAAAVPTATALGTKMTSYLDKLATPTTSTVASGTAVGKFAETLSTTGSKVVGVGSKVVGVGAGVFSAAKAPIKSLKKYHSFERYLNDDVQGIRSLLEQLPQDSFDSSANQMNPVE